MKAEPNGSAFVGLNNFQIQDSINFKKVLIAKKLFESGEYDKSLRLCLDLIAENQSKEVEFEVYLLLAKIFKSNNEKVKAIRYLKKVQKIIENKIKDSKVSLALDERNLEEVFIENLLDLGNHYLSLSKLDSSVYYHKKVSEFNSLNKNTIVLKANSYSNLANIFTRYEKTRDLVKAKEYIQKAIKIYKTTNEKVRLSKAYGVLAGIYDAESNDLKAKKTYIIALDLIANENSDKIINYKEILYYNLAWTLYKLKDYKAYDYLEKSYILKDSINDANLKTELKKIELRHNIDLIKKEEENKRFELKKTNWMVGFAGFAVSLLLLYLVNLYKLRQRNLKLELSKKELEQRKKLDELKSESQVKIINAAIDGKESERKQIAETLHDNVSALLSSANMHLQASQKQFKGKLPIELEKTQEIILEASQKIRDLSHNLVSSVLLKFGLEYAVKDIAKKYSNSSIKIHTVISNVHRYSQDYEIKIFNILQELLNNVLKHSDAKTAYVTIEESQDNILSIIVKDNGVGFETKNNFKSGIGLNQIEARIHMMKGSFKIESSKGSGTKISIQIPVKKRSVVNHA